MELVGATFPGVGPFASGVGKPGNHQDTPRHKCLKYEGSDGTGWSDLKMAGVELMEDGLCRGDVTRVLMTDVGGGSISIATCTIHDVEFAPDSYDSCNWVNASAATARSACDVSETIIATSVNP